jgi:23S rRNA (guanosine2251-2'-O)-methyltransferase
MSGKDIKGLDCDGYRILYGVNPIREAFRAGRKVDQLLVRNGDRKILKAVECRNRAEVHPASNHTLSQEAGSPQHQGVVARVEALKNQSLKQLVREKKKNILCLMADGVQDPHNLGTLFRVADCAGVDLVVVSSRGSASVQLGSVAKSSAGAIEHQPLLVVGDLVRCIAEMKEHGFQVVCLEADAETPLARSSMDFPLCVVVGAEGPGVGRRVREACTHEVSLPLRGRVNSLNVAVAASLAVFDAAARRDTQLGEG